MVWFGYMTNGSKQVKKSVFLYCKDAAVQNRLFNRLKEKFDQPEADRDGDVLYVTVECSPETAGVKDVEWFASVLEQAANVGKRSR